MKTSTKQFPKGQVFDLEALEQSGKGRKKKNLPPSLLKMASVQFHPIFGPPAPSSSI